MNEYENSINYTQCGHYVRSFPGGGGGGGGGGGYSPKIPIRVCAAQRGRDFGTPYLERGIHFRDVP